MLVIRTVFSQSVAKAFQISAFQTAVGRTVRKSLAEPRVGNDMATRRIDLPAFTVPVVKFVKNEVEKQSLEKVEIDQCRNVSNKVVIGGKTRAREKFAPQKIDLVRCPSPTKNRSDDSKTNPTVCSTFTSSHE